MMRGVFAISALLAWLSFTAATLHGAPATRPAEPAKPVAIKTESGKPFDHKPSGFSFPFNVGAFRRVSVYQFDRAGQNISVGYSDPSLKIILTMYVYPSLGVAPDKHFAQTRADILKVYPKAKLLDETGVTVEQDKKQYEAQHATYEFIGMFDGAEQDLNTEAYLFVHGQHFVKYRITYQATRKKAAGPRVEFFLKTLTFPQPPATQAAK